MTLLADSLDFGRTPSSGFDGIAIYNNFIAPEQYAPLARGASDAGLVFSFNVNPGYDEILLRDVPADSCYEPRPFVPPASLLDFDRAQDRERAAALAAERIRSSLGATVAVQSDPALSNFRRGFLLVYANSFNEWHEGHAFEPMKDEVEIPPRRACLSLPESSIRRLSAHHSGRRAPRAPCSGAARAGSKSLSLSRKGVT